MKSIFCTKINNFVIQPSTAASENTSKISHNGKIHHISAKKYLIKVANKNTTVVDMITISTKNFTTTSVEYVLVCSVLTLITSGTFMLVP